MVSFARIEQIELAAEVCQSFTLDNGAFTSWKTGVAFPFDAYVEFVEKWRKHPGFDWALIPDVIDGDAWENDQLIAKWPLPKSESVPVWHLHETVERLRTLCHNWPRVALGSSGAFSDPGSPEWWDRMSHCMSEICDEQGRPPTKLHGLRMLNPTIFSQIPLASADSTNVARNIGLDSRWDTAAYTPRSQGVRALILADRIEAHCSAATWQKTNGTQHNFELIG